MKSSVYLFNLCGVLLTALMIITAACSSSREVNKNDDKSDSGAQSDTDGGTSSEMDDGEEEGREEEEDPTTTNSTSGRGGSAGSSGSYQPYDPGASDSVRCDTDGYCYWPDGHFCDPWGMCCYPDGHCEQEDIVVGVGGSTGISPVAGAAGIIIFPPYPTGGIGGSGIDPNDFTDEPWKPPIDELAEPKWKSSGDTLCTEMQTNIMSHSVWSDSRGVFVLVSGSGNGDYYYEYEDTLIPTDVGTPISVIMPPGFGTCVGEGCPSIKIYFNDGNGWETIYQEDQIPDIGWDESQLTGFDKGPLVVYGYHEMFFEEGGTSACGLATIENGTKTCEPIYYVDDVFIVNDDLAYAIYDGEVIRYNGDSWGPLPGALVDRWVNQIWAN
jgi:hypothetical protein